MILFIGCSITLHKLDFILDSKILYYKLICATLLSINLILIEIIQIDEIFSVDGWIGTVRTWSRL